MNTIIKHLVSLSTIALVLSSCSGDKAKSTETTTKKFENVKTQILEKKPIARNLEFSTTLIAYDKMAVAPTSPGRIQKILVEVGTRVSKNQLLVEMDKSNYIQSKVTFENLETDFQRVSKLNESNNISKQVYDQTKAKYEAAKTSLQDLEKNTFLRAPFSGVISAKNYENGELYNGNPVLTLVDISSLKATINIPETYYPLVSKGMHIDLTSDIYPNQTFPAAIDIVYPTIDESTHTFSVQLKVPNAKQVLRPGMFARVGMQLDKIETITVPYQAVLKLQGSNERYVFLNNKGIAKRVSVTLGDRFDDRVEIISSEIKQGDELVVLGQARLNEGSKLNVVK